MIGRGALNNIGRQIDAMEPGEQFGCASCVPPRTVEFDVTIRTAEDYDRMPQPEPMECLAPGNCPNVKRIVVYHMSPDDCKTSDPDCDS